MAGQEGLGPHSETQLLRYQPAVAPLPLRQSCTLRTHRMRGTSQAATSAGSSARMFIMRAAVG